MNLFKKKSKQKSNRSVRTPNAKASTLSYYSSRSERNSELGRNSEKAAKKSKRNPKSRAVQHIPALLVLMAIVGGLLFLSTLTTSVKIKVVDENNTTFRDQQVYKNAAEQFSSSSIVNRSKVLFDTNGLEAELKQQFPEIATVSITVPAIGRTPVVKLQTTKPALLLTSGPSTTLIGSNGVALARLSDVKQGVTINVPAVEDKTGIDIEIGKVALPEEQAVFIGTVVEQLEKQSIPVDTLTIPTSPYDLYVRIKGEPYFVKFNILEDPKQQAGSFIALKRSLDSQRIKPAEYVDVRAGERVFYK